jgi:ADP-heptose:LPS heptosyltransferase
MIRAELNSGPDIVQAYNHAIRLERHRSPVRLDEYPRIVAMAVCTWALRCALFIWRKACLGLSTPQKGFVPSSIVVYVQGMLGDVAVHIPAMAALRKRCPNARFICVCHSEGFPIGDLLGELPWIDELHVLAYQPVVRRGLRLVFSEPVLASLKADLFVNLSPYSNRGVPGFVGREIAFARKIGARWYLGDSLSLYGVPTWTNSLKRLFVRNEPRRGWRVLAPLGIGPADAGDNPLPVDEACLAGIDLPDQPFAVIHPGAKHGVKLWPAEYFSQVASHLARHHNLMVLVTGSAGEAPIADRVIASGGGQMINLAGKTTIPQLIALLAKARVVVCNDSGPMHLAGLLNRPTLALFGTRIPVKHWYPVGDRTTVMMHYHPDSFSYDDDGLVPHRMEMITPGDAIAEIDKLLCES